MDPETKGAAYKGVMIACILATAIAFRAILIP